MSKHLLQFAELPGASQFAGKREVRQITSLSAGLKNSSRAAHCFGQNQTLRDVLGDGLFAVHVLAGSRGIHRHRRVPVRSGGDQHRIDIAAVE